VQTAKKYAATALASVLALFVVGCGKTKYPLVPVEGRIAFADGTKLPAGTRVVFNPGEGGMGTASGITDVDGVFRLKHANGSNGAEVGKYVVVLRAPEGNPGDFYQRVPKEYCDAGGFTVEVKEGMSPLDLKIQLPKRRSR
jgi:hypothetical protein